MIVTVVEHCVKIQGLPLCNYSPLIASGHKNKANSCIVVDYTLIQYLVTSTSRGMLLMVVLTVQFLSS